MLIESNHFFDADVGVCEFGKIDIEELLPLLPALTKFKFIVIGDLLGKLTPSKKIDAIKTRAKGMGYEIAFGWKPVDDVHMFGFSVSRI
jgi:hypothetical protein